MKSCGFERTENTYTIFEKGFNDCNFTKQRETSATPQPRLQPNTF